MTVAAFGSALGAGASGLVSVIVPVHNRPELVVSTLESIWQQHYRPLELIVVDDGSTDDSARVVRQWLLEHSETAATWRGSLIEQPNSGAPSARNRGVQASRGEFIQWLDSDDLLSPGKIASQVRALVADNETAFAYCEVRQLEQPERVIYGHSALSREAMIRRQIVVPVTQTAAPLFRRQWVERVGPMRNDLVPMDDWEFFSRAVMKGASGVRVEGEHVLLRLTDQGPRLSWGGERSGQRNWILGRIRQLGSMASLAQETDRPDLATPLLWQALQVMAFARRRGFSESISADLAPILALATRAVGQRILTASLTRLAEGGPTVDSQLFELVEWLRWRGRGLVGRFWHSRAHRA